MGGEDEFFSKDRSCSFARSDYSSPCLVAVVINRWLGSCQKLKLLRGREEGTTDRFVWPHCWLWWWCGANQTASSDHYDYQRPIIFISMVMTIVKSFLRGARLRILKNVIAVSTTLLICSGFPLFRGRCLPASPQLLDYLSSYWLSRADRCP